MKSNDFQFTIDRKRSKAVVNKTAKSISNSAPKATDITDDMDKEMKLRTVGIQIGSKSGKGLVVQSEDDKLYILTCSHVCEGYYKDDKGTVCLYAANDKGINIVQISEIECSEHSDDIDLALVIVRNEVIPVEYKNLRQLNFAKGKKGETMYAQIWDDSFPEPTKKSVKLKTSRKTAASFPRGSKWDYLMATAVPRYILKAILSECSRENSKIQILCLLWVIHSNNLITV